MLPSLANKELLIDHIARFVKLPAASSSGNLPAILVVNVQVPLYPAAIFQGETDGEGMHFVLYFKLNETYSKELPPHFQESFRKLIDDEVEKVKGFPVDTIAPFRERLKILGRVVNVEDRSSQISFDQLISLNLMNLLKENEKPEVLRTTKLLKHFANPNFHLSRHLSKEVLSFNNDHNVSNANPA